MSIAHSATALAAIVALLSGCGESTGSSAAGSDASSTPETSSGATAADAPSSEWTGEVIPDGTYTKTNTKADARRLGLPKDMISEMPDGGSRVELKIAGDVWVVLVEEDGAMLVGDEGTATYDADGNWVTTSNSYGCPGCVATVGWTFKDQRLTLKLLDTTEAGDPVDLLIGRLVMEGEWARK